MQQPIKYELVVNLKTAKSLGFPISGLVLAQVDEVIAGSLHVSLGSERVTNHPTADLLHDGLRTSFDFSLESSPPIEGMGRITLFLTTPIFCSRFHISGIEFWLRQCVQINSLFAASAPYFQ